MCCTTLHCNVWCWRLCQRGGTNFECNYAPAFDRRCHFRVDPLTCREILSWWRPNYQVRRSATRRAQGDAMRKHVTQRSKLAQRRNTPMVILRRALLGQDEADLPSGSAELCSFVSLRGAPSTSSTAQQSSLTQFVAPTDDAEEFGVTGREEATMEATWIRSDCDDDHMCDQDKNAI
ncbi:hypothetical protein CC85DRAFT_285496 [Cutaneotrichosporon oleaginosum]|uniref:Uncharacterized protein n=1 Tax=Cutaneotrichosporon oleaginosum TaxID=879819 RepID=A0A0J0XNC0_9TREE|nr:uncharacterized protein CC85DRAFT_285496 [Cutaneotrichosporon oleaginosum]KLT42572.1 hypothetical protein CC85DRAFT_285496 [Cutaneotrichosporon oleaginosum]TXT15012.1 hypothetical protein COLE_01205 [Cutaneotrichosporon oleaginosum]